jgi:hypothetical protein
MKILKLYIGLLGLMLLMACEATPKKQVSAEEEAQLAQISEPEEEVIHERMADLKPDREPTDDELTEFGILKHIEDGAYPMFTLTIEFPEREMEVIFSFNQEYANFSGSSIYDFLEKYVSIYYTSDEENNLYDLIYNGNSVLGDDGFQDEALKTINGALSGAEEETYADLPSTIQITSRDGTKLSFQYFITPEMLAVNGKQVTAFYQTAHKHNITYLRASKY